MAAEMIRVRANLGGETLTFKKSDWDKYGEAEQSNYTVLGTEEEEQEELIKKSIADSKRYDAEVKKSDKKGEDPANVAARAAPVPVDAKADTTGLVLPGDDAGKG